MANLVKWNKDAAAQPDFPAAPNDTWVIRNLYHSWLGDYQDAFFENNEPHIHFVRDSSRDLVTYLDTQWTNYNHWIQQLVSFRAARQAGTQLPPLGKLPFVSLNGASGVGKSSETFGWIQTKHGSKALFINLLNFLTQLIWLLLMFCLLEIKIQ
jgi:hypothetical protein